MVLPANHAGHAGADGLVHQQVVQPHENRTQDQRHHHHPDQFAFVQAEKIRVGRALGEVDDAAQVAEQRHFDQRADQPDDQQRDETRPDLAQVVDVKRQDLAGGSRSGGVTKDIDQLFETTIKHEV